MIISIYGAINPTVLGNGGAVIRRINGGNVPSSGIPLDTAGKYQAAHQLYTVSTAASACYARHAGSIVGHRCNCARYVAAMITAKDVSIVRIKVKAIIIIYIAITVIVYAIAWDFSSVFPDIRRHIPMVWLYPLVYNGYHHIRMSLFYIPSLQEVYIATRQASGLTGVVVMPLLWKPRIDGSPACGLVLCIQMIFGICGILIQHACMHLFILGFRPLQIAIQGAVAHHDIADIPAAVILDLKPQMQAPFHVAPTPFLVLFGVSKYRSDAFYGIFMVQGIQGLYAKAGQDAVFIKIGLCQSAVLFAKLDADVSHLDGSIRNLINIDEGAFAKPRGGKQGDRCQNSDKDQNESRSAHFLDPLFLMFS